MWRVDGIEFRNHGFECIALVHGERKQVSERTYQQHAPIAQAFDAFFGAEEPKEEPEIEEAGDDINQAMDKNGANIELAMDIAGDGRPQYPSASSSDPSRVGLYLSITVE